MHTWSWHTWQELPYLTCSLLSPWKHGFFTQQFWPRLPQELVSVLHPEAEVYRVQQVHGNQVLKTSQIQSHLQATVLEQVEEPPVLNFPEADGLITEADHQALWVCSADCTPALIADHRTGQVAAVHAGWRGTAARILPEAIALMQSQGSQLSDLLVAMGPAIAGEVYQVTAEVAAKVGASVIPPEDLTTMNLHSSVQPLLERLLQLPDPPVLQDKKPQHMRLDVRRINALQLEQLGLKPEQIAIAPHCTYQQPENFFSYRRDNRRQVQWSGIVSQN